MNYELFPYIAAPKLSDMVDTKTTPSIFSKGNYKWMLIGLLVIAIGMFLLSGGASNKDPKIFDKDAVYSTTRITIAPILILAGLVIEIFAIFRKPKEI
jgi:FtsH-binding integral membrane protein